MGVSAAMKKRQKKKRGDHSPARQREVVAAFLSGERPQEIAERLGLSRNYVYQLLCVARRYDPSIPRAKTGKPSLQPPRSIHLPKWLAAELQAAAAARNMTVADLVRHCMEEIVESDILGAVLDN